MDYKEKIVFIHSLIKVYKLVSEKYPSFLYGNLECKNEDDRWIRHIENRLDNAETLRIKSYDFKDYESHLTNIYQEDSGEPVEMFWRLIKEQGIPLKRVNKMAKILKRGRIKDQEEYDFVTDVIVPYKQEGMITEEQEIQLNEMLGKFEMKNK
jgi:uncharacterized pyridoxamine 5'-phosphate oxidase family protein